MRIAGSETVETYCHSSRRRQIRTGEWPIIYPSEVIAYLEFSLSTFKIHSGTSRGRTEHGLDVAEPRLSDESMNGVRMEPQVVDEGPGVKNRDNRLPLRLSSRIVYRGVAGSRDDLDVAEGVDRASDVR